MIIEHMADGEIPPGENLKGVNCYTTAEYTADPVTYYIG